MNDQQKQVLDLFNSGLGTRKIAKILNVTRHTICKIYKELGLVNLKRCLIKQTPTEQICKKCNVLKPILEFNEYNLNNRIGYRQDKKYYVGLCFICEKENNHIENITRYKNNLSWHRNYTDTHKKERQEYNHNYHIKNRVKLKIYKIDRKVIINKNLKIWSSNKRKNDPCFKLRGKISSLIKRMLLLNNSSKQGKSVAQYIPYSMQELKEHIEKQFESWMTWENWGVYKVDEWNDNDSSTWKWQLDHVIPQSILPYDNMDCDNFKKCWALENLRPLNAKQNLLDGCTRARHNL